MVIVRFLSLWLLLVFSSGLARSAEPGSVCGDLQGWTMVPPAAENDAFRVWYDADPLRNPLHADDERAARALEERLRVWVWNETVTLLAGAPMSDAAEQMPHGDGGAYDFCIGGAEGFVSDDVTGETFAYDPGHSDSCTPQASFSRVLRPSLFEGGNASEAWLSSNEGNRFYATAAHELAHGVQYAFPNCQDHGSEWLMEGVAVWVEGRLFPGFGFETEYDDAYLFATMDRPIYCTVDLGESPYLFREECMPSHQSPLSTVRPYGAYVFLSWLASAHGDALIQQIVHGGAVRGDLDYVDRIVDFETSWPAFSVAAWNLAPQRSLPPPSRKEAHAEPVTEVKLDLNGAREVSVALDSTHPGPLSVRYVHITSVDPAIRSFALSNTYRPRPEAAYMLGVATSHVHVQAFYKLSSGTWSGVNDWTDQPVVHLCRERPEERFTEMIVVISNSAHSTIGPQLYPFDTPYLLASNVSCQGWSGRVSLQSAESGWGGPFTLYRFSRTVSAWQESSWAWDVEHSSSLAGAFRLVGGRFRYDSRFQEDLGEGRTHQSTVSRQRGSVSGDSVYLLVNLFTSPYDDDEKIGMLSSEHALNTPPLKVRERWWNKQEEWSKDTYSLPACVGGTISVDASGRAISGLDRYSAPSELLQPLGPYEVNTWTTTCSLRAWAP